MTRAHKALFLLLISAICSWGCAQNGETKTSSVHEKRIRAMEAKIDSLAAECHSAIEAREKAEQKLAEMEKDNSSLTKQLDTCKGVMKERDELKEMIETRTNERDGYHTQLEALKKDIRSILTRVEAAVPSENKEQKTASGPKL